MPTYKQCFCCGNFFLPTNENKTFCSIDCKQNFVRCAVCGNYYPIEDDNIDTDNYTCSEICKKKYKFKSKKDIEKLDFSNL